MLWIDAICIDQRNFSERGQQVFRMADMYSKARGVVLWLGPERYASALELSALSGLGSEVEVDWSTATVTPLTGEAFDQWWKKPLPFQPDQHVIDTIARLLNRAWFIRLWILQEVRLARNGAEMQCGYNSMFWDDFRNAALCLRYKFRQARILSTPYWTRAGRLSSLCSREFSRA